MVELLLATVDPVVKSNTDILIYLQKNLLHLAQRKLLLLEKNKRLKNKNFNYFKFKIFLKILKLNFILFKNI